jgi:hypothetical protein
MAKFVVMEHVYRDSFKFVADTDSEDDALEIWLEGVRMGRDRFIFRPVSPALHLEETEPDVMWGHLSPPEVKHETDA